MKKIVVIIFIAAGTLSLIFIFHVNNLGNTLVVTPVNANMKISSTAFENNGSIPRIYTCDGQNTNPPLEISEVPEGTKSLALIMEDPDAPGGIWVHWLLWDMDPRTVVVNENSVPLEAIQGTTSFGHPGYGGPCPPSGTHRYFFKVYALDTVLDLSPGSWKNDLISVMNGHILGEAELVGTYGR
jgi:Raf kinase inhibitor-like YbhB/YbcL family protein